MNTPVDINAIADSIVAPLSDVPLDAVETPPTTSPSPAPEVRIVVDADTVVSFASQQNAVPFIRSVTITNDTPNALNDVVIRLVPSVAFAETHVIRLEHLESGESRTIRPVPLKLAHAYLASLTEAEQAEIAAEVHAGGAQVTRSVIPVEVLAFDQWGGTRTVPELLSAFSTPNHPHIDRLLAEAGEILAAHRGEPMALTGYSDRNREHVWMQISALFAAVARRSLQYALPPASFASTGQKVRMADRILEGGVATCLDLTLLLSSLFEAARLNPVLLLNDGHAWVGCWLINASFPTSLIDDPVQIRKRIDAGEMMAIETTHLTQRGATLKGAIAAGRRHFDEGEKPFLAGIDVQRCRLEQIKPVTSREVASQGERVFAEAQVIIEAPPPLPPLSGETPLLDEEILAETPDDRIRRWRNKLLDLTLRNRLLNYKQSKVMIPLRVADPAALEDALADGKEWKLRALPPIMSGRDPRSRELARVQGEDPVEVLAHEAMSRSELLAMLDENKLPGTLNEIYLTVKTALEETGGNTLFLVLGFLRWAEDAQAEKTYLAPLILVPVTLKRASMRSGFSLVRHDDETLVNPTLLQALQDRHGVTVTGMDPPPADEHGVDVNKVFSLFRAAIAELPRWEVVPDVTLGVFSFHKHVMYVDLAQRQQALRKNRLVAHLIDRPRESIGAGNLGRRDDLDTAYSPAAFMAPMLADSSQLNALRRAAEGHDFVLEGPPGTGKSQTITNLICDALYRGQRVLFVSEKMAALGVVESRLKRVGLGPFCLQLHSAKATKTEILSQLNSSIGLAAVKPPEDWTLEVDRLARLRNDLNAQYSALHTRHPNGLTVYAALGVAIARRQWPAVPVLEAAGRPSDGVRLDGMRELARQMQAVAVSVGTLADHPLHGLSHEEWSHGWEALLVASAQRVRSAGDTLRTALKALEGPLGPDLLGSSIRELNALRDVAAVMLRAPGVPPALAARADDPHLRRRLGELRRHGEARNALWDDLSRQVRPEVRRLPVAEVQDQWRMALAKPPVLRWFAGRTVRARLIPYMLVPKRPDPTAMEPLLDQLLRLGAEEKALETLNPGIAEWMDPGFEPQAADWAQIAQCEAWGAELEAALARWLGGRDEQAQIAARTRVRVLVGPDQVQLTPSGEVGLRLATLIRAYGEWAEALAASDTVSGCERAGLPADARNALVSVDVRVAAWIERRHQLRDWCGWNRFRRQAAQFGLTEVIRAIDGGAVDVRQIAEYIEYCYRVAWLKDVMDRDEVLRTFTGPMHEQKIVDFRAADERFQLLTQQLIVAKLSGAIATATHAEGNRAEMALVSREIQKQRAHAPIRKLVKSIPNILPALKPCLLMSPLSVAQYLDPTFPPFDLLVFDEASQIPVWDAVGVIARAKQVVVVGDPKQLPPSAFFDRSDQDEGMDDEETAPPKDLESILEECMSIGMSRLSLDWHYRSAHESLIAFSNHRYYESRLLTFPSNSTQDAAVKLVPVNGIYDRGATCTNPAEAKAIVQRIIEHFDSPAEGRRETLGVVTFNAKQQRLIDDLLRQELVRRPMIEARMAEHGDERLFIKNLENVQGDERGIILFSTTYGKDAAGRMTLNFGPINQQGGQRRLNVAVTRARTQIEIFTSLRPDDIDLSKTRASGVADLKAYLDFALNGAQSLAMEASPTGRDPDSLFEREVMTAIRDAGWAVHPQVGCSGYRVDIGVVDRGAPGRYLAGVECDGATYHGLATARDRDRLRQTVLEGLGWTILRVWSTDWWLQRERCVQQLIEQIEALQKQADENRSDQAQE